MRISRYPGGDERYLPEKHTESEIDIHYILAVVYLRFAKRADISKRFFGETTNPTFLQYFK